MDNCCKQLVVWNPEAEEIIGGYRYLFGSDWEIDDKLQDAIDLYNTFKPTSALLLEDTRVAVDKLRKKLRDIDLDAIDENGKDKYTLNVITSTIKQVPLLIKDLDSAEKSITKEMVQSSDKMRGNGEKTIFDDDLSI